MFKRPQPQPVELQPFPRSAPVEEGEALPPELRALAHAGDQTATAETQELPVSTEGRTRPLVERRIAVAAIGIGGLLLAAWAGLNRAVSVPRDPGPAVAPVVQPPFPVGSSVRRRSRQLRPERSRRGRDRRVRLRSTASRESARTAGKSPVAQRAAPPAAQLPAEFGFEIGGKP